MFVAGLQGQFDKIDYIYSDFLGEPYDYRSVMHYDSKAFSKNGADTIIAAQPKMTKIIGKAMDLSDGDVRKVTHESGLVCEVLSWFSVHSFLVLWLRDCSCDSGFANIEFLIWFSVVSFLWS